MRKKYKKFERISFINPEFCIGNFDKNFIDFYKNYNFLNYLLKKNISVGMSITEQWLLNISIICYMKKLFIDNISMDEIKNKCILLFNIMTLEEIIHAEIGITHDEISSENFILFTIKIYDENEVFIKK